MATRVMKPTYLGNWEIPDVAGLGGGIAGIIAGLVMVILSPILSIMTGIGLWEPPKLIATVVYSPSILQTPGFVAGPVLVGLIIHLALSAVLGIVFGLVFNRVLHLSTAFGTPMLLGLVYGLVIWFVLYFLILPLMAPVLAASYQPPLVAQNLVFGIVLGAIYSMLRPQPYR